MRSETVALLRCPETGGILDLEPFKMDGDDVLEGRLVSRQGLWYRVEDGIADLMPLALRRPASHAAFCARYGLSDASDAAGAIPRTYQEQLEFFGRYHDAYESEVVQSPYYVVLDVLAFVGWVERTLTAGARALEIGCGSGRQSVPLAQHGVQTIGLDLSEEMVRRARRKVADAGVRDLTDFIVGCAERPPIACGAFDACVIYGSLHHFTDPPAAVARTAAALRPGGAFYLLEPHASPVRFVFDALMRVWRLWREEANEEPQFTEAQLRSWLAAGGVDAEIRFSTYLPPHVFHLLSRRTGERILQWTDRIGAALPGVRRVAGVIIAEGRKR